MLDRGCSSEVQANHFVPEVATPEESMANLDLFITKRNAPDIGIIIDSDAEMLDEPECKTTVRPSLGSISKATFLSA